MKHPILLITACAAGLGATVIQAEAQGRYGYRTAPNGECEVIDHRYSSTPILDRIRQDLRVVHEEVNRAFYGTRDEIRRSVHGAPPVDYHQADVNRPYQPGPNRSWGNFDAEYLAEVRRRKALEERERAQRDAEVRAQRYYLEQANANRAANEAAQRRAEVARQQERQREMDRQREIQRRAKQQREQRAAEQQRLEQQRERERIVRPREEPKAEVRPPEPKNSPRDPVLDEKPEEEPRNEAGFTETEMKNFPFAKKTDKPGFVKSPYPPFELLDVSDLDPGGLAMEPDSERIFRVPE